MTKKEDKRRKINILPKSKGLSIAVLAVVFIQELFLFLMMMLDILPAKYAALLIVIFLLVDFGLLKLMNTRKKITNKRLVGLILSVAVVNVLLLGCSYLYNTLDTMENISADGRQTEDYHVIVLEESKYENVKEIEGQTVAVLDTESKMYTEAKERLLTKVEVTYQTEADVLTVGEHLINAEGKMKDEIIFLSNANYQILKEENKAFRRNTRVLYSIPVAVKSDDFAKRINVTEDPFNIFISGVDTRGDISEVSRSDVNMLVTVNPETREILLTSIPRDSYVELHSYGMMDKLTHSGIFGVDETIKTVEDWLEVDINYYFRVNFKMLVSLVDAIGGITVDVPRAFSSTYWNYSYVEGKNQLDGGAALAFVRERKNLEDEDEERGRNQQRVLKAIINKVTSSKVILTNYTDILNAVESQMETNMSNKDMSSLVKMQLNDMSKWKIRSISIDGDAAEKGTYSMGPRKPLFVSVPRPESVEAAKTEIHKVMYPVQGGKNEETSN
ncbi:MAG: LCP family protein [Bacillota bacterium]|nr:LCP family protein [Bacillota bacterium]